MSEINCNNCAICDFKESLCHWCDEMKRLGSAEDIEGLLIKAFSEVDSPAKSNCIERQAAIDVLEEQLQANGYSNAALVSELNRSIGYLMRLPSAQPEQKWIPCSERLPDAQTGVIVSCMDDSGDTRFLYTSSGWVTTDGEYWIVDNEINSFVVAWMPLPAPYKGEDK